MIFLMQKLMNYYTQTRSPYLMLLMVAIFQVLRPKILYINSVPATLKSSGQLSVLSKFRQDIL
jgi:hypothetical protein